MPAFGDPREEPAAVWTGDKMIVFGDKSVQAPATQVGLYEPLLDRWAAASTPPVAVDGRTTEAVWTGAELIGWNETDLLTYEPATDLWDQVAPTVGALLPRTVPAGFWIGNAVLFVGDASGFAGESHEAATQ